VADEAKGLVPQVKLSKANGLYKAKEFDAAAAAFQEILDADPTNGTAAFYKGAALVSAGKTDEAKAAFEVAAANGQEANANKQLGNIYLKEASADLKAKKYADAVAAAVKANEYAPNAQALQLAGQASQAAGKNNDAIKYFEQYLEAAPTASNAGAIAYTVGALYQTAKNNAKAKEFYTKAASDPKYGAEAKKMLDALK
jgi:tetratricopeptide (TPR) repeat protein